MKSNIAVRLVIDSDSNKTYLSIEGQVEKATEKEKKEIQKALEEALSRIIGIKEFGEADKLDDFVPQPKTSSEFIETTIEEKVKGKDAEPIKNDSEQSLEEFIKKGSVKIAFPREYSGMTAFEAIGKFGEDACQALERVVPVLERNKGKFPQNEDLIKEIETSVKEYRELEKPSSSKLSERNNEFSSPKFAALVKEIESGGQIEVVKRAAQAKGTTLEAIIEEEDLDELLSTYQLAKEVQEA